MHRSLVPSLAALLAFPIFLPAAPAHAQISSLPALGAHAPAALLAADKKDKHCRTADSHEDPCAEIEIGNIHYTIAWDASTDDVTYLFTDDHHIVTDNGLAVGNSLRVAEPSGPSDPTIPYMKWFIDPKWKDKGPHLGTSVWYAALHKDYDRHFGDIAGFVQSRYIEIK